MAEAQQSAAQQPSPESPQWQTFVRLVSEASLQTGMQSVVLAAAVPAPGGFGPSSASAISWTIGNPPQEWREGIVPALKSVLERAATALSAGDPAAAAPEQAPVEGDA